MNEKNVENISVATSICVVALAFTSIVMFGCHQTEQTKQLRAVLEAEAKAKPAEALTSK